MIEFLRFWGTDNIAFTILGYPMSYVELIGTVFYLWSVWLVAQKKIATWPVGIVGILAFLALFYQIQLYSDVLEQVYYLVASIYGWWQWARRSPAGTGSTLSIKFSSPLGLVSGIFITLILSLALGSFVSQWHILYPSWFLEAASYPYVDAFTTAMSFTATLLMAHKRIECWIYWITVDIISVWLYYVKEVRFVALLYAIFLVLATKGLISWLQETREHNLAGAAIEGS